MVLPVLLSLAFGFGVILQAIIIIIYYKIDRKTAVIFLWVPLILALLMFVLPIFIPQEEGVYERILQFFFFSTFLFAGIFREKILPNVNIHTLLSFNLSLIFVFLAYFYSDSLYKIALFSIILIPSIFTFIFAFFDIELGPRLKLFLYKWFLVIIIILIVSQFSFGDLSFFFNQKNIESLSYLNLFFTGMVFLYLIINSCHLLSFYILEKHEKEIFCKTIIQKWEEAEKKLIGDDGINRKKIYSLFIILIQGGVLIFNYHYGIIPAYLLINIIILSVPQILFRNKSNGMDFVKRKV